MAMDLSMHILVSRTQTVAEPKALILCAEPYFHTQKGQEYADSGRVNVWVCAASV